MASGAINMAHLESRAQLEAQRSCFSSASTEAETSTRSQRKMWKKRHVQGPRGFAGRALASSVCGTAVAATLIVLFGAVVSVQGVLPVPSSSSGSLSGAAEDSSSTSPLSGQYKPQARRWSEIEDFDESESGEDHNIERRLGLDLLAPPTDRLAPKSVFAADDPATVAAVVGSTNAAPESESTAAAAAATASSGAASAPSKTKRRGHRGSKGRSRSGSWCSDEVVDQRQDRQEQEQEEVQKPQQKQDRRNSFQFDVMTPLNKGPDIADEVLRAPQMIGSEDEGSEVSKREQLLRMMPPPPPEACWNRPRTRAPVGHVAQRLIPYSQENPPSIGSRGHPYQCAAPCKYFRKSRGCKDGADCDHCHLCPWSSHKPEGPKTNVEPQPAGPQRWRSGRSYYRRGEEDQRRPQWTADVEEEQGLRTGDHEGDRSTRHGLNVDPRSRTRHDSGASSASTQIPRTDSMASAASYMTWHQPASSDLGSPAVSPSFAGDVADRQQGVAQSIAPSPGAASTSFLQKNQDEKRVREHELQGRGNDSRAVADLYEQGTGTAQPHMNSFFMPSAAVYGNKEDAAWQAAAAQQMHGQPFVPADHAAEAHVGAGVNAKESEHDDAAALSALPRGEWGPHQPMAWVAVPAVVYEDGTFHFTDCSGEAGAVGPWYNGNGESYDGTTFTLMQAAPCWEQMGGADFNTMCWNQQQQQQHGHMLVPGENEIGSGEFYPMSGPWPDHCGGANMQPLAPAAAADSKSFPQKTLAQLMKKFTQEETEKRAIMQGLGERKAAEAEGSSSAPSSSVVPTAPQAQDHEVTGESPEASPGDTHDAAALSSGHDSSSISRTESGNAISELFFSERETPESPSETPTPRRGPPQGATPPRTTAPSAPPVGFLKKFPSPTPDEQMRGPSNDSPIDDPIAAVVPVPMEVDAGQLAGDGDAADEMDDTDDQVGAVQRGARRRNRSAPPAADFPEVLEAPRPQRTWASVVAKGVKQA